MDNTPKALTTGEAAKLCGVNFRTIIRWIEKGWLKGYKLPGRGDHRIPKEELIAFLKEQNMPIPPELGTSEESIDYYQVLVVDDERPLADAVTRLLKRKGYKVKTAYNGLTAGILLQRFKPKVVILDLQMPGVSGLEVIEYIRKDSDLSILKILVVSAATEELLQAARDAGADLVKAKPLDETELLEGVDALMNG